MNINEFTHDGKKYVKNRECIKDCDKCACSNKFCQLIPECDGIYFLEKSKLSFGARRSIYESEVNEFNDTVWKIYYDYIEEKKLDYMDCDRWKIRGHCIRFNGPETHLSIAVGAGSGL